MKPSGKQTLLTKFFKSSDPAENQFQYLFEREEAKRKKEEEERLRKEREEAEAREKAKSEERARRREHKRIQKEKEKILFQADQQKRRLILEKKYLGKAITDNLFLGSRLVAKNYDWLVENKINVVINATRELSNYFEDKGSQLRSSASSELSEDPMLLDDGDDDEFAGALGLAPSVNNDEQSSESSSVASLSQNDDHPPSSSPPLSSPSSPSLSSHDKQEEKYSVPSPSANQPNDDSASTSTDDHNNDDDIKNNNQTTTSKSNDQIMNDNNDDNNLKSTPQLSESKNNNNGDDNSKPEIDDDDDDDNNNNEKKNENEEQQRDDRLELEYIRVVLEDSIDETIETHFQFIAEKIHTFTTEQQKRVLVHCSEGLSRSPSLIIAYLMIQRKWDLRKAYDHVLECNFGHLRLNDGFKRKLMNLDRSLFGTLSLDFFESRSSRYSTRTANNQISPSQQRRNLPSSSLPSSPAPSPSLSPSSSASAEETKQDNV